MDLQKIYKLKNLNRYNNKNHIFKENVAEHSFFVSLISLELCNLFDVSDDIRLKCLTKAILHDMPEIELNDITHDVKVRLDLYKMLKTYEDKYYKENFPKQFELMSTSDDVVDLIVDLSDILSVKQFIDKEISVGNSSPDIINIKSDVSNRLNKLLLVLIHLLPEKANSFQTFLVENSRYGY